VGCLPSINWCHLVPDFATIHHMLLGFSGKPCLARPSTVKFAEKMSGKVMTILNGCRAVAIKHSEKGHTQGKTLEKTTFDHWKN
jgi:hypothetical protein